MVAIARRIEACNLTARRRIDRLVEQGLANPDAGNRYAVTDAGRQALGSDAPKRPEPWVKVEAISAASARDVLARNERGGFVDDRPAWARSQQARTSREKAAATMRANKAAPLWLVG